MAMTPERSNPLHNFNLPSRLRWGTQRYLRCKKLDDDAPEPDRSDPSKRSEGGSQIEAIGEKLMLDFKLRMDNLKVVGTEEREKASSTAVVEAESSRPWNLRTRRSPAPGPVAAVGSGGGVVKRKAAAAAVGERSSPVKRLRGVSEEKDEKVKFRVPLKREEIEEDFLMMAGIKPPRRPKKRPRAIQKELDTLFPGLWLTEVTPGRYDVPEAPES
ncbi:hypothetical protein QQ045_030432 [Rhodiola kirilowii]